MKISNRNKPYLTVLITYLLLLLFCFSASASETSSELPKKEDVSAKSETIPSDSVKEKTTKPTTAPSRSSSLSWWTMGIGAVILIAVILYFIQTNMERKTSNIFETTIIDDIIEAIKSECGDLRENELRTAVETIIADHRCTDHRLNDLLRIEYEVEKLTSNRVNRTTAVAVKKQGNLVLKKATRSLAWEDLPKKIRSEFILKNEKVLVYSLYSIDEKEV